MAQLDFSKTPLIVVDTREPNPGGWEPYFSGPAVRQTLKTGDYSIAGCEHLVGVERKTIDDLVACLSWHRDRFEAELRRSQGILSFWIICEGEYRDLLNGEYRSRMTSHSAWESAATLMTRYRIPILMAGDARTAARLCESLLTKWYREHVKVMDECRLAVKRLKRQAVSGAPHDKRAAGEMPF